MNAERQCRAAIDQAYATLLAELPDELVTGAERLPRRLGLSLRGDVGWGEVFDDVAVLGLPKLVIGELAERIDDRLCACALRAHVFAMLAGRITIGVELGELEPDDELDAILTALERARNKAMAELRLLGGDRNLGFALPERELRDALADERDVFAGLAPATITAYLTISSAKQSLAFPAVAAAVVAAGFDCAELGHIHDVVLGSMLGLQIRDDVERWLEAPHDIGSWVVALSSTGQSRIGVLRDMLDLARDAFERAADAARELGATSLMCWARTEANAIRELLRIAERQLESEAQNLRLVSSASSATWRTIELPC